MKNSVLRLPSDLHQSIASLDLLVCSTSLCNEPSPRCHILEQLAAFLPALRRLGSPPQAARDDSLTLAPSQGEPCPRTRPFNLSNVSSRPCRHARRLDPRLCGCRIFALWAHHQDQQVPAASSARLPLSHPRSPCSPRALALGPCRPQALHGRRRLRRSPSLCPLQTTPSNASPPQHRVVHARILTRTSSHRPHPRPSSFHRSFRRPPAATTVVVCWPRESGTSTYLAGSSFFSSSAILP